VKIHQLESSFSSMFGYAARRLGSMWNMSHSNARDTPGGGMLSLGVSKGGGSQEHRFHFATNKDRFNSTTGWWTGINAIHTTLNTIAKGIACLHFTRAFESIKSTMEFHKLRIPDFLGGIRGLCPQMVQSGYGFSSESHFDFDVSEYCLSIWNSKDKTDPEGWYFLLPNLEGSHDGKEFNAVAIRLCDGTGIEWNGRMLRHCSTPPTNGINVFGTFFGIMKL